MVRETKIARWFSFESGLVVRVNLFRKETRDYSTTMWTAIPKVDGVECEATVGVSLREVLKSTRVVIAKQRSEKFKKANERLLGKGESTVYLLPPGKKIEAARVFCEGLLLVEGEDYRIDGGAIVMKDEIAKRGTCSFEVNEGCP